jgi:hypothetical protein
VSKFHVFSFRKCTDGLKKLKWNKAFHGFPELKSGWKLKKKDKVVLVISREGVFEVEAPTFSRQSAHRWRQGYQPYAPAALLPFRKFLALISVRGWVDPRAIVRLEGLGQLKNPMTSSGFDSTTCSIVPQPTMLPHALQRGINRKEREISVDNVVIRLKLIGLSLFHRTTHRFPCNIPSCGHQQDQQHRRHLGVVFVV